MSDPLAPLGDGHTALSEEDYAGLIPSYISTRGDLFDAEQRNISVALLRRPPSVAELLDDQYLRELHRAMFREVWRWAGQYRLRQTNIGVDATHIPTAVRQLVGDTRAWVEYGTYEADELAARFHHRLVAIHPFANGNGRHSRIATDYLLRALGLDPFPWGRWRDQSTEELRTAYLSALRQADAGPDPDVSALITFARS